MRRAFFLTTILCSGALSGCGKVDSGLLKKRASALAALETFEGCGFRQDAYVGDMQVPAQTKETWFRSTDEGMNWYMLTKAYGADGVSQMESAMAQRNGEMYYRYRMYCEISTVLAMRKE